MTLCAVFLLALSSSAAASAAGMSNTSPAAAPPQPAGIGIRLLDVPASTQGDPRARTYIIDRIAPGAEIQRRVRVENNTTETQTVRVYAGAAHIDGGAFIGEDAAATNELTSWTRLAQPEVELAPGGSTDVMVTIKVPADAAESEQYGAIWAEVRSPANNGVVQANRVGIRVYLSVGPGNGKPADFTIGSITASRDHDGNPQLSAQVTNSGGRALDIIGELRLTGGPGGLSAGPFNVQRSITIAPGGSQTVTFTPPAVLPNGPWTAAVKLKSGLLEREADATITFPAAGESRSGTAAGEDVPPWMVWALASGVVLVALALTLWLVLRARKRAVAGPQQMAGTPDSTPLESADER